MNHRPHRRLVDAQPKCNRPHQHPSLVRHPAFLILPPHRRFHFRVIRNRRNPALLQEFDRLLHPPNRRRIYDHAFSRILPQGAAEQFHLRSRLALVNHISQILAMEAGDIAIRLAHLQLLQNVVPHLPRGACRKRRNRQRRKLRPQPAQLPVVGTEFVSPLGNAMRLIHRKKADRHFAEPLEGIFRRQPLRRKIEQPILAARCLLHYCPPLCRALHAVDRRRRNPHLRQLRRLVLHQRDQRRNHHRRLPRNHRRKLVAQRLPAASRHHHASIALRQQTANDIFLLRPELVISPITPQHGRKIWSIGHSSQYSVRHVGGVCERTTLNL